MQRLIKKGKGVDINLSSVLGREKFKELLNVFNPVNAELSNYNIYHNRVSLDFNFGYLNSDRGSYNLNHKANKFFSHMHIIYNKYGSSVFVSIKLD